MAHRLALPAVLGQLLLLVASWRHIYRRNKFKRRITRVAIRTDQAKSMRERFLGAVIEE